MRRRWLACKAVLGIPWVLSGWPRDPIGQGARDTAQVLLRRRCERCWRAQGYLTLGNELST